MNPSSMPEEIDDFELIRTKGYQRKRYQSFNSTNGSSTFEELTPRHMLLVTILVAFLGGYLVGKQDSTPTAINTAALRINEAFGREPEKSMNQILGDITKIRLRLESKFRQDYGDFYGKLFDPIQMDHVFNTSPASRDRLKRRLMQRILEKVVNPSATPKFVWATAGDSAAAGHGNMYNQSYAAILEKTVRPIFDELGIEFIGRNYAMGWYNSAPELAYCMEAVYGNDVDALIWDFSLQDGQHDSFYKTDLWIDRVLTHANLPVMLFVDKHDSPRRQMFKRLEEGGIGYVFMDKSAVDLLRSRVPATAEQPVLKNWICPNGAVEGSLPCDDHVRFNMCEQRDAAGPCLEEKYNVVHGCEGAQHSYNPGWKEHLFKGRLLAHFLMDVLEEALITIDQWKHPNAQKTAIRTQYILDRVRTTMAMDYRNASLVPLPQDYSGIDSDLMSNISSSVLFRSPAVCHTAVLPSQSRYLGITQESGISGDYTGGFDQGVNKLLMEKGDKLQLAYDPSDRHRCVSPKIDHKDVFLIRSQDGWQTTVIPNHAEIKAYRQQPSQGIIMVCLQICPNGKCSDDYVGFGMSGEHGGSRIEISVDDKMVTQVHNFDKECHVLGHDEGIRWGAGQAGDGRYKLRIRLVAKVKGLDRIIDYATKVSSIIII